MYVHKTVIPYLFVELNGQHVPTMNTKIMFSEKSNNYVFFSGK